MSKRCPEGCPCLCHDTQGGVHDHIGAPCPGKTEGPHWLGDGCDPEHFPGTLAPPGDPGGVLVTADSPAAGLPQEAVDAAALRCPTCGDEITAELVYTASYSEHRDLTGYECDNYECGAEWDQWGGVTVPSKLGVSLLAAEQAKVAGLRETIDKVRARAQQAVGVSSVLARDVLALLPAVSEGAPTQQGDGRDLDAFVPLTGDVQRTRYVPATVVQPTGTVGECPGCGRRPCICTTVVLDGPGCGHTAARPHDPHQVINGVRHGYTGSTDGAWEPCPSQSAKGEQ
jgi:hypothetical protein